MSSICVLCEKQLGISLNPQIIFCYVKSALKYTFILMSLNARAYVCM